jgi:hypothetical protein
MNSEKKNYNGKNNSPIKKKISTEVYKI